MIAPNRTIASCVVDVIAALGADTVFTLTGGMAMHLNHAVATHPRLKPVYCQHEQACVAAAEGYAKASDFRRAGIALVTAGPGVANTVTALLSAFGDSTPLIVLSGQIKTADIDRYGTRTHGLQEIRSREIISPCVKRFLRLGLENYQSDLAQAVAEAFVGRPGPVFIEIPLDVQGAPLDYAPADITTAVASIHQAVSAGAHVPDNAPALSAAIEQLLRARRPLLYIGNGCRIAGIEEQLHAFLERHSLPAIFSWISFDILPSRAPWHFGCPGGLAPIYANEILAAADSILFLGARLDLATTAFQRELFGAQATRCFVDIDAAELAKFAGLPNTASLQVDLRLFPRALAHVSTLESAAEAAWLPWCQSKRSAYLEQETNRMASPTLTVYGIAKQLSAWSAGKLVVSASSGYAIETLVRFFEPGTGTRFFNGSALGSMGFGLPHALGAAFASGRQVICVEADGGLMLNLQELATLSYYAPPGFVLFVLNNDGYESIRSSQTRHFGQADGVDSDTGLYLADLSRLAHAFDLRYQLIDCPCALEALLPTLSPGDRPILVDLRIEKHEYRGPSLATRIDEQGKPHTAPLAELTW